MAQFEPHKDEISQLGSLLFIAAEKRGGLFKPEKYLAEHPIAFPFLLDEQRAVTKSYGVHHAIGIDALNIARPATFIVRRHGAIGYIYVGKDQRDRADIAEVLQYLKQVSALPA